MEEGREGTKCVRTAATVREFTAHVSSSSMGKARKVKHFPGSPEVAFQAQEPTSQMHSDLQSGNWIRATSCHSGWSLADKEKGGVLSLSSSSCTQSGNWGSSGAD